MLKTILHIDMNSYFATAEQQANPYLRGRPVGIIKAEGRGCIIAASIEAKKYKVKTGCTVWEAKKLCPQIILVPSDMDKYFALTQGLIKIIGDYSPTVEVFSIDEMFVDVTDTQKLYGGGVLEMALAMKQRVKQDLGEWMRCSVGVAWTKILAKLASEMDKPDGLTILSPTDYLERTQRVAVEEVCGIGYARARYLHDRGAYTLGQARKLPNLPRESYDLVWLEDTGDGLTTIDDLQAAKSVSRTYTTYKILSTKHEVRNLVRNLVEEATAKLREMNMAGRTFLLYLTPNPSPNLGEGHYRVTVKMPSDDPLVIFDLLVREYGKNPVVGIRQAGVHISNLAFSVQRSVFQRRTDLLRATDEVNQKYGLFTVYPAQLMGGELIRPEVTGYLGDKFYRLTKNF